MAGTGIVGSLRMALSLLLLLPPLVARSAAMPTTTPSLRGQGAAAARSVAVNDGSDSEDSDFTGRLLGTISSRITLPLTLRLTVNQNAVEATDGDTLAMYAGQSIEAVQLVLAPGDGFSASAPRLKFVNESADSDAAFAGACSGTGNSFGLSHISQPFGDPTGTSGVLWQNNSVINATLSAGGLSIKMGGSYRICYSDTGTFSAGNADVLNVSLDVAGVYDSCTSADCLTDRRYYCYARKDAHSAVGSCVASFAGAGSGLYGAEGKMTWSQAWSATWNAGTGAQEGLTRGLCGSAPDVTVLCSQSSNATHPVCNGTDLYIEPNMNDAAFAMPMTKALTAVTQGYTVAACYCPALDSCNSDSDFIQQIGVVLFFAAKPCDPSDASCSSSAGFSGVVPKQPFTFMVHCPPDGCPANGNSRMKLVDFSADNDRPSWDSANGCRTAAQTALQASPLNCYSATNCVLTGGTRQDFKTFGSAAGSFQLAGPGSDYEVRNFHSTKLVDACFCVDGCADPASWFKVGHLVLSPYRLLHLGSSQLTTVNVPGSVGLYRGASDRDSLGLMPNSLVKLLIEQGSTTGDELCQTDGVISSVAGGLQEASWRLNYQGALDANDTGVMTFNSGASSNLLTATRAGIVAVCYCRSATCATVSSDWILAARMTVRGPAQSQTWTFSTGIAGRISYAGYGLSSSDTLRITPSNVPCSSNSKNPDSETTLLVGCPLACATVDNIATRMRLATKVLDYASVGCDGASANCRTVYVRRITVRSSTTTEVEFDGNPGLNTGDQIVLGSGIQCGNNCSAEHFAAVGGQRSYGNGGAYDLGAIVTATGQGHIFTMSVGWAVPAPQFDVLAGQGQWTRTSMGSTAEEVKGTVEKHDLKVCWAHSGDGTYVEQVGTVSFVAPALMPAQVSLTTVAKDVAAPLILSFTTGQRNAYSTAVNSLQLRLVFTNVNHLEPHYATKDPLAQTVGLAEYSPEDATQGTCGKLFLELWSADSAAGFPLPRGCYYRLLGDTREVFIVFEPGSGLHSGKTYQIVMAGAAKNGLLLGNEAVSVMSMDDVVLRPYQVIEVGRGSVNKLPLDGATITEPRFKQSSGLSVLGGSSALLEVGSELDLSVQLAADSVGRIVKETILRLFMMPLTQWDMSYTLPGASECNVACTPHASTRCGPVGQCVVEPVVTNSLRNTIKVRLPVDMTTITDVVQHVFRIRSLSLPSGGFFPTRIGAQLTTVQDLAPYYAESSGDYLWKRPANSRTVGELIVRDGDGNARPFRGDTGNVLYAHLRLGATLRRTQARTSAASLTVTLPQGYTGIRVSAAPRSLGALNTVDAPGRGTLSARSWSCVGVTCTYTLEVNDVIPAGTDLVASFLVNNPEAALRQDDLLNKWYVTMRSTGDHTTGQEVEGIAFQGTGNTDFGSNVAVLGSLTDYCVQPTDFTISPASGPQVVHDLLIFFRPAQPVASGYVLVDAPALFDFSDPCLQQELDAAYHRLSGGSASDRTWPLPAVQSCRGVARAGSSTRNRAKLSLGGLLHQQRRYGLRLRVANPQTFTAAQLTGWSLSTATSGLQIVDGTPTSASFNPLRGGGVGGGLLQSWGLYADTLNTTTQVAFHLSSMKPYDLIGKEATVVVFPLRPGIDTETSLRITAPHGYEWYFSGQDFIYRADLGTNGTAQSGTAVSGATADLPGRVPVRNGNVLTWPVARYSAADTYGFIAKIRVPPSTPRGSSNAFFVEFGYSDEALAVNTSRALAARVEAPAVQALTNAQVDYTTSIRGQVNKLRFQVETVTHIPQGGGLFIRGPVGFSFPDACQPEAVAGTSYTPLPDDLSCRFKASSGGTSELLLVAGESGIVPGFYAFQVAGSNPASARASRDGESTACGWTECWHFHSLADAADPLASPELDARASTPGFAIKEVMAHAHLVPLSQAARTSTGRNDLPTQQNRLAFSFTLERDIIARSMLVLRGPAGFQFQEDCLANAGVVTEPAQISAAAAGLLQPHGAWEASVPVLTCTGSGSVARLEVGAGLKRSKPYLFCIKVQANPSETPAHNKWTIESDGEASMQFDGFTLMTFTKASVTALRAAARPSGQQPLYFVNVTFRPYTDVPAPGGTLVVTAPSGFGLVSSTTGCPLLLEERDPLRGPNAPAAPFLSSEIGCLAGTNFEVLMLKLTGSRPVVAGRDYTLTARIANPAAVMAAAQWKLESFSDQTRGTALDAALIPGFAINPALSAWGYFDAGESMRNGGMNVDNLQLRMTFPDALSHGDAVVILAPVGYELSDPANREGERQCKGLSWGSSAPFTASTVVTCEGRRLSVLVGEAQAVPAGTDLRLFLSTRNPSRSPSWAENFWHIKHLSGQKSLLSSDVFAGWAVVPQLVQVQVSMSGQAMPAGSVATLDFAFVAVSAAASVSIEAKAPSGFDFSQSFLPLAGQEPTLTVGTLIRCTVSVAAGVQTLVRVRDVRLAATGGMTQFDLTTYTATGTIADRTLGFNGFRLPGSVQVSGAELLSEHQQSPSMYPVKALWQPQLGATALARFTMTFSNFVSQGQSLMLQTPPYTLQRQNFQILDVAASQAVPALVTYAAGSALVVGLQGSLQANREYSLEVTVVAPQQATGSSFWILQTSDGGALPTSLNSQISTGFHLVSNFGLAVSASRIPPLAEVEVTLQVSFGSSATPAALKVVAPVGFNFSQSCLVTGGAAVSSCIPGAPFVGRPTAQLGLVAGSVGTLLQNIKLRVTTPRASPSVYSWFIEGVDTGTGLQVGWGEDSNGLQVQQMRDVSVTYGGIPGLQTQVVIGFRTSEVVDRGGQIQVRKPPEYDAQCNATTLQSISLPGVLGCEVQSSAVLLTLNGTLQRGEYAFAFSMRTPTLTPGQNQFSLVLVDKYQAVQDAAMDVAGQTIHPGYPIQVEPLSWTSSEAGQASSITVGFSVRSEIPLGRLGKVLITFPQNFAHAIERECSVEQTNTALPLLAQDSGQCSWVDIRNLDRLLIHLDPNRAVLAGTYLFRFPVTVPEQLPAYNVWLVTFCGPSATSCLQPHNPDALLTFPLAGFRYGQQLPGWKPAQAAAWHTMASPLLALGAVLLPMLALHL